MNPFILSGFAGEKYFCDRKEELKKLKEAFENERNVTLISLRRMGKSALVKFLFEQISSKADCIYVDIFSARNLQEMVILIANAVTEFYGSSVKDYVKKIGGLLKSLGATLSFDDLTAKPKIRFSLADPREPERNIKDVFDFLDSQKKRVLVVFDEFQQVRNFSDGNAEAILRSHIQQCKNINFIFAGSSKNMLESIFSDRSKPFYQSTQYMYIYEINKNEYAKFIKENFNKDRQKINDSQIYFILDSCRIHTYYAQFYCNRLYSKSFKGNDSELHDTLREILKENEPVFYNYENLLTKMQWDLVSAIAKEGSVSEPLANDFIKKYNLSSSSSIQRALKSLLTKEIIVFYKDVYIVYDVFFSLWLKSQVI